VTQRSGSAGFFTPARIALIAVVVAALALVVVALQSGSAKKTPATPTAARGGFPTPIVARGSPRASYPQHLAGADGRSIDLRAPPQRIVALAPGAAETLFAIGAGAQVAGVVAAQDYPGALASVARVDPAGGTSAVAALQPDLVLLGEGSETVAPQFEAAGLPVLVLATPITVDGVLQQMQFFGDVTDHQQEAQSAARGLQARVNAAQRKLASPAAGVAPRVYIEVAAGQQAATSASLPGDLLRLLAAQNIAPRATGTQTVMTTQQIVAANPAVIVLAAGGAGESAAEVRARDGWSGIAAVQNNRVVEVAPDLLTRPGPRIVDGLETLAKLLYPDRF